MYNFIINTLKEISPWNNIRILHSNIKADVLAGITVGIIALPLALAFGEISRLGPVAGIWGAIAGGIVGGLFGGCMVVVSGPTAPKAAQIAAEAVGAKMVSFCGLRGSYDFMAVFEGDFSQGAGIKMATEGSGTLCNITILEEINLNDVAANAAKIAQKYKGVGQ